MHQILSPLSKHPHLSALCRLSIVAGSLHLYLAAFVVLGQESPAPAEPAPPARQNPILREYFRKQYLEVSQDSGYQTSQEQFLEKYVDRQIDHYLKSIQDKLEQIKNELSAAERARADFLKIPSSETHQEAPLRLKGTIKELAEHAHNLRTMLAFVLIDLKGNSEFKPEIKPEAVGNGFEKEIEFLREQVQKADEHIRNYFFSPNHTVSLDELKGENMLAFLYRLREMAEKLHKQL